MPVQVMKDRNLGKIGQVTLGALPQDGGTRGKTVTVGGAEGLPFQHYEGAHPCRPVIAMEVWDCMPEGFAPALESELSAVWGDPCSWAKHVVAQGADLVFLRLMSADPERSGTTPAQAVQTVKAVLAAIDVPLAVVGCGIHEVDNPIISAVAEACAGENLLLGAAEQESYNTVTAACMVHKHTLLALSPLDINICKQLNILIGEMGMPLSRVIIDPNIGGLGYGLEYAYSIGERGRIGALQGDKMLSVPVLGMVGAESWKAKEAGASVTEFPGWGEDAQRGILWEATTAVALLQSGIDILVMRSPKAAKLTLNNIQAMMQGSTVE